jgi:hypothetical protein
MEGCQMPFSQHHIDPTHIEAMRTAFNKVCDALLLKCDKDDPMTDIIVTKIVALAKAGEHDADRLAALVIEDLADAADGSGELPTRRRAADATIPDARA